MGVRMMVEALDHAPGDLPDVHRLALIALAERMDDRTRTGYHPAPLLARRVGRSRPTVTRILRALTDRGLLSVVKQAGRGRSTVYRMARLEASGGDDLSADNTEKVITQGDDLSGESDPQKVITLDDHLSPSATPKRSSPSPKRSSSDGQKVITQDDDPSLIHPVSTSPRAHASGPSPSATPAPPTGQTPDTDPLRDDPAARAARIALREHTGRDITTEHATRVAAQILDGRRPTRPAAYITEAIHRSPERYLPAALPPPVTEALGRPHAIARTATEDRPAEATDMLAQLRARLTSRGDPA